MQNTSAIVFQSMIDQLTCPDVTIKEKKFLNNSIWYQVELSLRSAEWLRQHRKKTWIELSEFSFLVHERMFTLLSLKWAE